MCICIHIAHFQWSDVCNARLLLRVYFVPGNNESNVKRKAITWVWKRNKCCTNATHAHKSMTNIRRVQRSEPVLNTPLYKISRHVPYLGWPEPLFGSSLCKVYDEVMLKAATAYPRNMAGSRTKNLHVNQMTKAEHTDQLGIPSHGVVFTSAARMRRSMKKPETSYHVVHDHFLRDSSGNGFGGACIWRHHSDVSFVLWLAGTRVAPVQLLPLWKCSLTLLMSRR